MGVEAETNPSSNETAPSEAAQDEINLKNALTEAPDELLVSILASRLGQAPEHETPRMVSAFEHSSRRFSGPLPPPEILSGYEQIQHGFASRVIRMAEREQTHRHGLEKSAFSASANEEHDSDTSTADTTDVFNILFT